MEQASFDARTFDDLKREFMAVREAQLFLFGQLGPDVWLRTGTANGKTVSVRGLAYIIVGHVRHHMTILSERYVSAFGG